MSHFRRPDPAKGVFETLLVLDGVPIELAAHLERMEASVRELFGAGLPSAARELVTEEALGLSPGRLRLTAAPGSDGTIALAIATASVDRENIFPAWERAIGLFPFSMEGWCGAHKWADRTALAELEASAGKGCLPLLLDTGDEVLEASRANLFAVEGETLVTPPLDGRILAGVARSRAIEAARSSGLEVREEALGRERLLGAGEAFLTGSVRGLEPVRAVGDTPFRAPGRASTEVAAAMQRAWHREEIAAGARASSG
jgi:para-aminobenzoate synthetase/4-amino-4-deoxychorismate lyase